MSLFDSLSRKRVCPHCRQKGARQFLWVIKCPNIACSHHDPNMMVDPRDLSPSSQDYEAFKGTFYPLPTRDPRTGKFLRSLQPLPQTFDPGPNSIRFRYRNFRGDNREYIGDKRTLRIKGNHITICLAPTGKRVAFDKQFIENLSELEAEVRKPAAPSARERQILGYHRKRGTSSPLYESIRQKYPDG